MGRISRAYTPLGPIRDLFEHLERLHTAAGEPSVRTIAHSTGDPGSRIAVVPSSTVHKALKGPAVPRWNQLELIVEALGADPDQVREVQRLHAAAVAEERLRGLPPGTVLLDDYRRDAEAVLASATEITTELQQDRPHRPSADRCAELERQLHNKALYLAKLLDVDATDVRKHLRDYGTFQNTEMLDEEYYGPVTYTGQNSYAWLMRQVENAFAPPSHNDPWPDEPPF